MPRLVQGDGRDDGDLVLRSATCLAARQFSAEIGVNRFAEARGYDLDLSLRQVGILPISHRPQNLVVQQPGRVDFHAQVAAELQRGDPSLPLRGSLTARAWPIREKARNQVVSGNLVACMIVPAVSVA